MNESIDRCQLVPLSQLAVIVVDGRDAAHFLAAQLGRALPVDARAQGSLAAWHDARGRVQGLFRVFKASAERFWLLTPAGAAPGIVADLRRYVLRSELELRIDDGELDRVALLGDCKTAVAMAIEGGVATAQPGPKLTLAVGPATAVAALKAALPSAPVAAFELAEIRLGIPSLDAPLRGEFLPQMLDLDRLGAVEFDKGCYPGQEVIVRLQHRGSVKRRLAHLTGPSTAREPAPGDAIIGADGARVGRVVRAVAADDGLELLAVVDVAAPSEKLRLDDGEALQLVVARPA